MKILMLAPILSLALVAPPSRAADAPTPIAAESAASPAAAAAASPAAAPAAAAPPISAAAPLPVPALSKPSAPAPEPPIVDAGPVGFALRAANKESSIRFHLQLQADTVSYFKEPTPARAVDAFFLRRAIPWIDGTLPGGVSFLITYDFSRANYGVPDAYLNLKVLDALQLRFGKFRSPIGLERLQPTGALFFNEFAVATNLVPVRDLGFQLHGELAKGHVGYALALLNGAPDNGQADLDSNSQKEWAGRFYIKPFSTDDGKAFSGALIGVAGTIGRKLGSIPGASAPLGQAVPNPGLPTLKSPSNLTIFSYQGAPAGTAASLDNTAIALGQQRRLNVHAYYSRGPFGLLAEYIYSEQRVGIAGQSIRAGNKGWHAEGSLFLFGAKAAYDQAQIKQPFDLKTGSLGAVEIVARVSQLSIDSSLFPVFANPSTSVKQATEVAFGANWYVSQSVRLLASYNRTSFEGGAKNAGNRPTEHVAFGRAQVSF